ncbi:protein of unknown function [Xenorhabdus doucetiae]|uniref:Uncharacterized protein n=1 Tax=Xenorhabdus doucetiae TaxID=351671 RepID=A0A068QRJ5_9GAMM|nr:protein of unknown function [Xenorhabdus doucetiae]
MNDFFKLFCLGVIHGFYIVFINYKSGLNLLVMMLKYVE